MAQHGFRVAHDAEINWPVAADFLVGNVHLRDLHAGVPSRRQAEAHDKVEARADNQHRIGFLPRLIARAEKAQRMILRDDPPALRRRVKRDVREIHELLELVHRARPEDAGPSEDDRTLRLLEHRDRLPDQIRIGGDARYRMRPIRKHHFAFFDPVVEHVARQIDIDRAGLPAGRHAKRLVDDLRDAPHIDHSLGVLGDRLEHPHLVHLLKRAHPGLRDRARPAQRNDRHRIDERIADAGDQVGDARARGREAHARLADHAAVGMRRHRRGLLVAHIDRAKTLDTARGHIDHRTAGEIENGIDAFVLQRLRDEIVAADLGHDEVPPDRLCKSVNTYASKGGSASSHEFTRT